MNRVLNEAVTKKRKIPPPYLLPRTALPPANQQQPQPHGNLQRTTNTRTVRINEALSPSFAPSCSGRISDRRPPRRSGAWWPRVSKLCLSALLAVLGARSFGSCRCPGCWTRNPRNYCRFVADPRGQRSAPRAWRGFFPETQAVSSARCALGRERGNRRQMEKETPHDIQTCQAMESILMTIGITGINKYLLLSVYNMC